MRRLHLALLLLVGCQGSFDPLTTDDDDDTLIPVGDDDDSTPGDDDDSAIVVPPGITVVETPLPPCEAPVASPGGWSDGLSSSGVSFQHATDPSFTDDFGDLMNAFAEVVATGVVAADLDDDGAVDLFFTQTVGPSWLFWGFGDGTFSPGPQLLPDLTSGLTNAADVDGDGDLDLLVGGRDHLRLLLNDGARGFDDVTDAWGLLPIDGWAGGSAWADVDGDGDLDLFAGGYSQSVSTNNETFWQASSAPNRLYRNDGAGFTEITSQLALPAEEDGAVLHAVWSDFDRDGDPDLLVVNDFETLVERSRLYENLGGGAWLERIEDTGIPRMNSPMGALVRDLDRDGRDDLWFTDFGEYTILRGLPGWDYLDASLAWMPFSDLLSDDASWSVLATDVDGDGEDSVFVAYGPIPAVFAGEADRPQQQDRVFEATGNGIWVEVQDERLPAPQIGRSRGAAEADLNGDGVPDLVVPHIGAAPSLLLGRCTANRRLGIELRDAATANTRAVGGRVRVQAGGTWVREVHAGGRGTFSGSEPTIWIGVAGAERADITVTWPDGEESVIEGACTHCRIRIGREP